MVDQQISVADQLAQLNTARALVFQDPAFYPQIFNGILPIVTAPNSVIELRRWGADFLAETFSTPMLAMNIKQELALSSLDPLLTLINETQTGLLKSVIQCCASVYPLVFRHICANRDDVSSWEKMAAIKSRVLGLWDNEAEGIRLACIKLVQRIVLVQTPGASDPRRIEKSEVSLTLVPINHPLLLHPALEAEAQGLLDRLLSVFLLDKMDAPVISATLNCLPTLIKTRATISSKILNLLMAYNPLALAMRSKEFKDRFVAKSIEKTMRTALIHLHRISQHIQRLMQVRADLANEEKAKAKRPLPSDSESLEPEAKHQRNEPVTPVHALVPPSNVSAPTNSEITSYATLYTLTGDQALSSFDVQQLRLEIVLQITLATIFSLNQQALDNALDTVRSRYQSFVQSAARVTASAPALPPPPPLTETTSTSGAPGLKLTNSSQTKNTVELDNIHRNSALGKMEDGPQYPDEEDDDDDYIIPEPEEIRPEAPQIPVTSTEIIVPVKMDPEELKEASEGTIERMFGVVDNFEKSLSRKEKAGLNRLAAPNWDRDGWITVLSRLSTRALGGIDEASIVESHEENIHANKSSTYMRERLYAYVMADFRGRIDTAVAWLNEEWYNDKIMSKASEDSESPYKPQYVRWMTKVMDGIVPYLEATDRVFLRFLSDLPEIPVQLLQNLRMLCLDPERSTLGFLALQYLTMLKPPMRNACLDIVEELWRNHNDVQVPAKKILQKFRPEALTLPEAIKNEPTISAPGTNGVTTVT